MPVSEPRNAESVHRCPDGSLNDKCQDKHGSPGWSCIEHDGTGLWCDECLALAERVTNA